MKVLTWDYDNSIVTEWVRSGDCNHCGECCLVMIYIASTNADDARKGCDTVDELGVWCQQSGIDNYWQVRNIAHDEPCDCFERLGADVDVCSQIKGALCATWPLHPNQVECFDNCSYSFTKLTEWAIDDYPYQAPPLFCPAEPKPLNLYEEYVEEIDNDSSIETVPTGQKESQT